jgi:hypothetical protein
MVTITCENLGRQFHFGPIPITSPPMLPASEANPAGELPPPLPSWVNNDAVPFVQANSRLFDFNRES